MSWQSDVLIGIGAPVYPTGVTALTLWAQSEGMPSWENNWLATTETGFGGYAVNGVGVKAYPTEADGVAATVATLEGGYYGGIIAAFQTQGNLQTIWQAINSSPWCGGCQTGHYPVALYDTLGQEIITVSEPTLNIGGNATGIYTAADSWENVRVFARTTYPAYVISTEWIQAGILLAGSGVY